MKRYIKSAELPGGYLKTNQFNSRINDNNNVLEAIEIAIASKFDQFGKMIDRQMYLTSGTSWEGKVTEYPEGYYIQLEATRSSFQAFVSGDSVIRKPMKLSAPVGQYDVSGDAGHVQWISPMKPVKIKLKPWSAAEQLRAQQISEKVYPYLVSQFYDTTFSEVYTDEIGEEYGVREGTEVEILREQVIYAQNWDESDNRVKKGAVIPGTVHYTVGINGEVLDENLIGYKTFDDAKHALDLELDRMKKEANKRNGT